MTRLVCDPNVDPNAVGVRFAENRIHRPGGLELHRLGHVRVHVELDIAPAQREQFALAHTRGHGEDVKRPWYVRLAMMRARVAPPRKRTRAESRATARHGFVRSNSCDRTAIGRVSTGVRWARRAHQEDTDEDSRAIPSRCGRAGRTCRNPGRLRKLLAHAHAHVHVRGHECAVYGKPDSGGDGHADRCGGRPHLPGQGTVNSGLGLTVAAPISEPAADLPPSSTGIVCTYSDTTTKQVVAIDIATGPVVTSFISLVEAGEQKSALAQGDTFAATNASGVGSQAAIVTLSMAGSPTENGILAVSGSTGLAVTVLPPASQSQLESFASQLLG